MLLKGLKSGGDVIQNPHVGRREVVECGGVVLVDISKLLHAFGVRMFDCLVLFYAFYIATKTGLGGVPCRLVP